jgi:outer membrane protein assembly factor BamB
MSEMRGMPRLTDDAIREALTLGPDVRAPFDLGGAIRTTIDATPQRRARPWGGSGRSTLAFRFVVVGLLVLALIAAILLIGSRRPTPTLPAAVSAYRGGPERTGIMPGPGPQGTLASCWQPVALKGPVGSYAPAVGGGIVFIGDAAGFVTAADEATGKVRWQQHVGDAVNSGPALADGLVFVGSDDGNLTALAVADGTVRWHHQTGARVRSSATVIDGVVYFGSDDGHLYALDAATGDQRWVSDDTGGPIDRAVAIAADVIYAGSGSSTDATFDAFDRATGRTLWAQPARLGPGVPSTPAVADGRVFVASGLDLTSAPHVLYALDASTGTQIWAFTSPNGLQQQVTVGAVANGIVYVVSYDKAVYALDVATMAERWPAPFVTHGALGGSAGFVDGTLYVGSTDRSLYAIDGSTGVLKTPPYPISGEPSGPAIVDGRLFVATTLGQLVCVSGSEATPGP